MSRVAAVASLAFVVSLAPAHFGAAVAACTGDCDGDGRVAIDELLTAVRIALGDAELQCPGVDADRDGVVAIDELLRAVDTSLAGCPPTPTPTPLVQMAPVFPTPRLYRAFPGYEIAYPLGVVDPNGDPFECVADDLPQGATLDDAVLEWTPAEDQVGEFDIPVTCTDEGDPPLSADGMLTFAVSPLHPCIVPRCDPASGCDFDLVPPEVPCCQNPPADPARPVLVDCPLGPAVFVGRAPAFTALSNCDVFRVTNFNQSGAQVSFKIAAQCVNTLNAVSVELRMDAGPPCPLPTPQRCRRPMVNFLQPRLFLTAHADGSTDPVTLQNAPVIGGTPFFDLQGTEANLVVTLKDSDGLIVEDKVRLLLTFTPSPTVAPPSPTPTVTPTASS